MSDLDTVPTLGPYPEYKKKRSLLDMIGQFGSGLGGGLANQIEFYAALAENPVDEIAAMASGAYQMARHPFQAGNALLQYGKQAASSPAGLGQFVGDMASPRSLFNVGSLAGKPVINEMTAYHGSPHKFDAFDSSKIGTGEGAQAYGHGLYFAEDPKVAGQYQRQVSSDVFRVADGELFDPSKLEHLNVRNAARTGDLEAAIARAQELANSGSPVAALAARDLQALQSLKSRGGIAPEKGHLYNVDIPDEHINKMLDWDAPLSEQPELVRKALADVPAMTMKDGMDLVGGGKLRIVDDPDFGTKYFLENAGGQYRLTKPDVERLIGDGTTGVSVYQALTNKLGSQVKASEYLKSLGIPGIRYLDAGSRQGGKGTRNFVVFDDSILKILKRE